MGIFDDIPKVDLLEKEDSEPKSDLGKCDECQRECKWDDSIPIEEGDWEHGYWKSYECPECGGGLEPTMSDARFKLWKEWEKENQNGGREG